MGEPESLHHRLYLVLELGQTLRSRRDRVRCVHRLEGSRFGACLKNLAIFLTSRAGPENVITGGSRKLPLVYHLQTV